MVRNRCVVAVLVSSTVLCVSAVTDRRYSSPQINLAAIKRHHLVKIRDAELMHCLPSSCHASTAFSLFFAIHARVRLGVSLTVKSGRPSLVFR